MDQREHYLAPKSLHEDHYLIPSIFKEMKSKKFNIVGIGNAIVDILVNTKDSFLIENSFILVQNKRTS